MPNIRILLFFIFLSSGTAVCQKPNIVFILADDLGYGDLSCYGQKKFKTPNIDRLAAMGMRFNQHYSGSTVCAPSRSTLMTGQHTGHTYIRDNHAVKPEGEFPLDKATFTLAEMLQTEGYRTGAFGKWGLGYPGSEGDPNFQGFDEFYGYNSQWIAHSYYPYHLWRNQKKEKLVGNEGDSEQEYAPALIHKQALAFIETNKNRPFFLFYPSNIPHAEIAAPKEEIAKFKGKFGPETPFIQTEPGDKNYKMGGYGSQKDPLATRAAMISILDEYVGQIIDKLAAENLLENTVIMFSSDNGPSSEGGSNTEFFDSNGPLRGHKRDFYEGGIRVPFIAAWKNKIRAGSESDHVAAFWDFFPTACDLVQRKSEQATDGLSFLPTLLETTPQPKHDFLYWEFGGKQAVLMGNWKCIKLNINQPEALVIELYNLKDDLGETKNVAEAHPDVVAKALDLMNQSHTYNQNFPIANEKTK